MKLTLVLLTCLIPAASAAESRVLNFQSAYDLFTLTVANGQGSVEGKAADLKGMDELLPVLLGDVPNPCPDPRGHPDLTVREGATEKQSTSKPEC